MRPQVCTMAERALHVQLTPDASLKGFYQYARGNNTRISAFRGIPYAAPPTGTRRFQPPESIQLWNGCRDATSFGAICPQDKKFAARVHHPLPFPKKIDEDCLFLNVYTPNPDPERKLPVMVWIHGGSFVIGYSDIWDGTALAAYHDVVVVSINYRLGVFGFLCTGDSPDDIRGNMGLLDQLEALRWIQKYITRFGGDPNNVTLFGESAGAICISMHTASPLGRGLFHKAICQSGTALYPDAVWTQAQAGKFFLRRISKLGCQATATKDILEFLKDKSSTDILRAFPEHYAPKVKDNHFFPSPPEDRYKTGEVNAVEVMTGYNNDEGFGFLGDIKVDIQKTPSMEEAEEAMAVIVKRDFYRHVPADTQRKILNLMRETYLQDKKEGFQLMQGVSDCYGDIVFVAPAVRLAQAHSVHAKTFLYKFEHRPFFLNAPEWIVNLHGNEIPYVFGEPFLDRLPNVWPDSDKLVSRKMMSYWTNFAKTGNPNGSDLESWPAFTRGSQRYLSLLETPEVRDGGQESSVALFMETLPKLVAELPIPVAKY